jgi:hypothetical protein
MHMFPAVLMAAAAAMQQAHQCGSLWCLGCSSLTYTLMPVKTAAWPESCCCVAVTLELNCSTATVAVAAAQLKQQKWYAYAATKQLG